jgi:hypothetical protein
MRLFRLFALALALAAAACVPAQPPPKPSASPPPKPPAAACATCPTPRAIAAEVSRLRGILSAALPQDRWLAPRRQGAWVALARRALDKAQTGIARPQLLVVVDRNPAVQRLAVVLADPGGAWRLIGGSKASTGETGRVGYFITPRGVFLHDGAILDYRALGTKNEYGIRGLGLKGMRVWDFGWQEAKKGWEPGRGEIRLLLHATDPVYLAPRLGRPASKGCIRIPAAMNRFLDVYGVLDREYEELALSDPRYAELLLPDRRPTLLAGDKLVVADSSAPIASAAHTGMAKAAGRVAGCR